ncbi:MAG: 4Fe-4S dicluster domain-containing protein [Archaeoglobales archaeon]|nr:4Fe-4S dicluster domain-containing protein [Archaeoglobales archaeon]
MICLQIAVLGCKGCRSCDRVCPVPNAIVRDGGKVIRIDPEKCVGCLECVKVCPYRALMAMD